MYKSEIQINELNKLYDEIYYNTYEETESALDIINNLISEKEYQEFDFIPRNLRDIVDLILDLYDELIILVEEEALSSIRDFIVERQERIANGEMDEILKNEYSKSLDENFHETLISKDDVPYKDVYENDDDSEDNKYYEDVYENGDDSEENEYYEDEYDDY